MKNGVSKMADTILGDGAADAANVDDFRTAQLFDLMAKVAHENAEQVGEAVIAVRKVRTKNRCLAQVLEQVSRLESNFIRQAKDYEKLASKYREVNA
jgi:hypothetical protein